MEISKIETLAEYKKAMKTFVRGVIKSKVFADETTGKVNFVVDKDVDNNVVTMRVENTFNAAEFVAEVSTRVFNKVVSDLYTKTIEQFNKLKGFAGMTVSFTNQFTR